MYKWHNEGANYPLLSSNKLFCLTPCVFLFFCQRHASNSSDTETKLLSVPLMKALAVCCHCMPRGVDDQHQLRFEKDGGHLVHSRAVEVPLRSQPCFLFFSFALTPAECRLTNTAHRGGIECLDSEKTHSAVH